MFNELRNYAGINVLSFFLENPSREIHIKELARVLKISSSTSKTFCDLFTKKRILLSEKKSNSIFFKLNNESDYVRELKRFFSIDFFSRNFNFKLEGILNVSIYGSYASGEYCEKSDVDLLVISRNKTFDDLFIEKFQSKIKKEVNVTKFTLSEWTKIRELKDPFYNEIEKNNFSLFGGKLE